MYDDPIVADIRKLRDEYARRFGYDLDAICRDLREQQKGSGHHIVRRQAKRPGGQDPIGTPKERERSDTPEQKSSGTSIG